MKLLPKLGTESKMLLIQQLERGLDSWKPIAPVVKVNEEYKYLVNSSRDEMTYLCCPNEFQIYMQ